MAVDLNQTKNCFVKVKKKKNRIQRRYSRFFYNLLTAPRTVSNTYAQVARAQPCANHVQHIECLSSASVMLRATWYEGTAQLLSLTELKSDLFELYFYWLNHKTDEGGEETGVPGENPWRRASENATYYSPKIQAPSETRTRAVALVAG